MPKHYRCHHCGKSITRQGVAALAIQGDDYEAWCFKCWDNPDEGALREYQAFGFNRVNAARISPGLRDLVLGEHRGY